MNRRVVIVSAAEGFMVRGLETKLMNVNVKSEYLPLKLIDVTKDIAKCDKADMFVIFTDDTISDHADVLVFLKDYSRENDKQIIVIGQKEEFESLEKYIPDKYIYAYFNRPLDMEKLITDVEKYMSGESQASRKKTILIVDDDVSYMTMIMDWLSDLYRISVANSGMQAITWLANNKPDLILLDYEMPITTGPQVLEMIKSGPETADIPVMFLTGKGDKESIMKVLSLKPAGYLLKTIERAKLRENIANFFEKQKAAMQ